MVEVRHPPRGRPPATTLITPGSDPPVKRGRLSPSSRSPSSSAADSPRISADQAAADATNFATSRRYQALSVKHNQLKSKGQNDYYQVKLQLGRNGRKHGTTNVWVNATSSPGTVTAPSGSGLNYRDTGAVPASTADANAVSAAGGGSAYKTSIHGLLTVPWLAHHCGSLL